IADVQPSQQRCRKSRKSKICAHARLLAGLYTLAETDQAEEVKTVIDGKSCQHDGFQPALNLCRIFQSRVGWC
ncbi:Hypothetical predicted protein, partial [Cloeon dipterum]